MAFSHPYQANAPHNIDPHMTSTLPAPQSDTSSPSPSVTGHSDSGSSSQPRTKTNRRQRKEIVRSCAECRRLKLRCDRKFPCTTCTRRGCAAICPEGYLTTGQGNRFVLASTEDLHDHIQQLSYRIRALEDGLRTSHARDEATVEHPLLAPDLLALKAPLQRSPRSAPPALPTAPRTAPDLPVQEEDGFPNVDLSEFGNYELPNMYNISAPGMLFDSTSTSSIASERSLPLGGGEGTNQWNSYPTGMVGPYPTQTPSYMPPRSQSAEAVLRTSHFHNPEATGWQNTSQYSPPTGMNSGGAPLPGPGAQFMFANQQYHHEQVNIASSSRMQQQQNPFIGQPQSHTRMNSWTGYQY